MNIKLLTGNVKKYQDIKDLLMESNIELDIQKVDLTEIQTRDIRESATHKARDAALKLGYPVIVDDVALYLHSYDKYPGPLVKHALNGLGIDGLRALLKGKTTKARLVCALSISTSERDYYFEGEVEGYINTESKIENPRMMLSSIFKCSDGSPVNMRHRELAFEKLIKSLLPIRADISRNAISENTICDLTSEYHCVFCQEFDDVETSVFNELVGEEIKNRIVYQDDEFIVLVPIGQFVEGGLLLLTKKHIPSFAHLSEDLFGRLSQLVEKIKLALKEIWGEIPIVFEHGPALDKTKGKCCVDHAHFNIFPVSVDVHQKLLDRIPYPVLKEKNLRYFRGLEDGYLYVDSPISGKHVYDGLGVPSQLIRRHITEMLGFPERWDWRHHMGTENMKKTLKKLESFR
jgi:XTP/dITP diphosphohydrolase